MGGTKKLLKKYWKTINQKLQSIGARERKNVVEYFTFKIKKN